MDVLSSYSISFTNINLHFHMVNKGVYSFVSPKFSICAILHSV